jgi:hypothetical protein
MTDRLIRHVSILAPSILAFCGATLSLPATFAQSATPALGIFENQSDVGAVTPPGTAVYDPAADTYTLTAAGANLWGPVDAF